MGTTIWVLSKNATVEGDDWDHSAMFGAIEKIDHLCDRLGLAKLSTFLDWTDFQINMSEDDENEFPSEEELRDRSSWFDPSDALPILKALQEYLTINESERNSLFDQDEQYLSDELLEEIDDCIVKIENIEDKRDLFHLCVVM